MSKLFQSEKLSIFRFFVNTAWAWRRYQRLLPLGWCPSTCWSTAATGPARSPLFHTSIYSSRSSPLLFPPFSEFSCSGSSPRSLMWYPKYVESWSKAHILKAIWRVLSHNGVKSIFVNLRYLRLKLLHCKDDNKKIYDTFDHNFKNMHVCIMSYLSFERQYIVL